MSAITSTRWLGLSFLVLGLAALPVAATAPPASIQIGPAQKAAHGFLVHPVQSPHQDGPTRLRVLLPDRVERSRRYPVLYVLPVAIGDADRYGDGLLEVKKLNAHNQHHLICVQPNFTRLPWYADHPTERKCQQETYLLQLVDFVDRHYPTVPEPAGRLLLGFSKSGWGAFTLLLRHLDRFGKAAAWDAPMMMAAPGKYGSGPIFGTGDNFARYQVTSLLEQRAGKLGREKRLGLLGYGNFRQEHQALHELLNKLDIPHEYVDGPRRQHDWHSGWVADALRFLTPKS